MDVESRLARQNQPFFRKPKATRSGVRSFTGFPVGCSLQLSQFDVEQRLAVYFYGLPSNRLILFRAVVRASGDDLDDVLLVFFAAVMHLDFVIDAFILE